MEKTSTGVKIMKHENKKNRREQLTLGGKERFYGFATDG
jgi:hypothetical protein